MPNSNLQLTGKVDLQAAGKEGKRPTFTIAAYNGGLIQPGGFGHPVVVDLAGMRVASPKIPILLDHDSTRIVGQSSDVQISERGIYISGVVTGDDQDAAKVVAHARNGFEWQASIGAKIEARRFIRDGEKETINGREIKGPAIVADRSNLYEVSFVAIGSDSTTHADISATHNRGKSMAFEDYIEAAGFGGAALTDAQEKHLRAAFNREHPEPVREDVLAERQRVGKINSIVAKYNVVGCTLDDGTKIDNLAAHAIEAGLDVRDVELIALRASTPKAQGIHFAPNRGNTRMREQTSPLECGLLLRAGHEDYCIRTYGEQAVEASGHARHATLLDTAKMCVRLDGGEPGGMSPHDVIRAAFSNISLPGLLSNVSRRALESAYNDVPSTWLQFAGIRSVKDFRTVESYRPNWAVELEEVAPDGEIKHGTVSEEKIEYQAKQFARMFSVSRVDIINDDLGFLDTLPREMARAAKRTLDDLIYRTLLANGGNFFHADNNNLLTTGSELSVATLGTAFANMRKQTDANGHSIDMVPRVLAVPPSLESAALTVLRSLELAQSTAGTGTYNPVHERVKLVVEPRLENETLHVNADAKAWYLFGSPADAPLVVAFLDGQRTPTVEQSDSDFNKLGLQFRVVHDFGASLGDHRAAIKATGAAS